MSIKEKLELLVAQTEKNLALTKKRAEGITKLKASLESCQEEIKAVKVKHNRECHFNRDALVQMELKLNSAIAERAHYAIKLKAIEDSFDTTYASFKQRLNAHYYTLQQAFNNFVKSKSDENTKLAALEAAFQASHLRVNDLEKRLLDLFFQGAEPNNE